MANILSLLPGEWTAFSFISSLAKEDISSSEILARVAANGLTIRQNTGLNIINYLRNNTIPATKYLNSLNMNVLPSIARIPQSITTQLRNFAYTVSINGVSQFTGEQLEKFITVSTNSLLSKQQALDTALTMASNATQSGGLIPDSGSVVSIQQNSAGLIAPLGLF